MHRRRVPIGLTFIELNQFGGRLKTGIFRFFRQKFILHIQNLLFGVGWFRSFNHFQFLISEYGISSHSTRLDLFTVSNAICAPHWGYACTLILCVKKWSHLSCAEMSNEVVRNVEFSCKNKTQSMHKFSPVHSETINLFLKLSFLWGKWIFIWFGQFFWIRLNFMINAGLCSINIICLRYYTIVYKTVYNPVSDFNRSERNICFIFNCKRFLKSRW